MKKNTNFKSILALVLCFALLCTAMLTLSSCKKDKFNYELSEDKSYYTITKYTGKAAELEIPAEHDGLPVKAIGREAFLGNTKIKSIVLPESIESIGFKAFEGCTNLSSIGFTDKVKVIDMAAFSGCTSLTEVSLPAGVTELTDALFQDCTALTTVTIPEGVTGISSYAFIGCSKLGTINVADKNHHYTVKNNCLIDLESSTLVVGMSGATIPADLGIVAIAPNAFHSRSIDKLVIPDTVKTIGNLAFYGCKSLESVEILGAETIGEYAFAGCQLLYRVVLPATVTEIGTSAFANLPRLTNVFYAGYAFEFSAITLGDGNEDLTGAHVYYYTEDKPVGNGKYWHYVDGIVTIWF